MSCGALKAPHFHIVLFIFKNLDILVIFNNLNLSIILKYLKCEIFLQILRDYQLNRGKEINILAAIQAKKLCQRNQTLY